MERILIRGGMVYDPVHHKMEKRDLALAGSEIVSADGFWPDQIVDAEGCIVSPGLIDFHLHCYTNASDGANDVDSFCLPNGVTTCVDGGTAGSANFVGFYQNVVCRSTTRVMGLLHVSPEGLTTGRHGENQTPADWDVERMHRLCRKYPDVIKGLKVRMSAAVLDLYGLHEEPLVEGLKLAEHLDRRVVVHVNNPNVSCGKIAGCLRAGDVYCHMYAGSQSCILDENGIIMPEVLEARKRGVKFDACNGRGNFLFRVAEPCIEQGFLPDIISSDVNPYAFYRHPLISFPRLISKYLMFGMTLEDVLDTATIEPAKWLGMESLASLEEGTEADIAVWKLKEKPVRHLDVAGEERMGRQVLVPQMTIRNGIVVYCQSDFM